MSFTFTNNFILTIRTCTLLYLTTCSIAGEAYFQQWTIKAVDSDDTYMYVSMESSWNRGIPKTCRRYNSYLLFQKVSIQVSIKLSINCILCIKLNAEITRYGNHNRVNELNIEQYNDLTFIYECIIFYLRFIFAAISKS